MYPKSIYRIEFSYNYCKRDPINKIIDALLDKIENIESVTDPLEYGEAFPVYVVSINIDKDSPNIEILDSKIRSIFNDYRRKR